MKGITMANQSLSNKEDKLHVGIIGAGAIGQAMAKQLVRAGIKVTLSNSRGPASLTGIVEQLGPKAIAGTVLEAAASDIVFLRVNWEHLHSALANLPAWDGRI